MLYLEPNLLALRLSPPKLMRGTPYCAAPRLPGHPPKNERSSDDSDLGGSLVPEPFRG